MSYISCKDVILGYEGHIVSKNINFELEKGDYLCIVGENGAGKSTLMKTLLHLVPPIGGEISYGDGLMPYEIGYLPQQTAIQKDFPASVWEVVLSGNLAKCGRRLFYSYAEKKSARENMEKMDIWDLKNACYRNLSGGQQQRVLLARALCATTKLLVLDEPVTGLDPKATAEFYELIDQLNAEGTTIIMVSHDMRSAVSHADKILHVSRKQLFFGNTGDYLESDAYKMLVFMGGEEDE